MRKDERLTAPCPSCGRMNRPGARYCASCQTPLDATALPLQPGRLLDGGTYRVLKPLGKGGMGAVYLVAQTKAFDRPAVVKEVIDYFDPADAEARKKAADRFEAEARTLGDLRHPGVPDLYAYFSEAGHNFLVMEYIEGTDLRVGLSGEDPDTGELRPGSRLAAEDVLTYAGQICEVLDYLASRQPPVIHNDIKPGNIIIDSNSGRAVLVDFGTAKTRYLRTAGKPDKGKDSIYGTVGYAAPELYHGRSEPRSDVYSLAATTYHLLTDDDPRDHPSQYPQLSTLPPALAALLQEGLAHDVEDRPTAAEFGQQLERYLAGQLAPLRPLAFPGGEVATSRDELLVLLVEHWRYAASILGDGTISNWLRRTLHDGPAAQAAEAAVKRWPDDADAALDAFVRGLEPALLDPGQMELRTTSLRLSEVDSGQRISGGIEIANRGQGFLRGEAFSTQPWVRLASSDFSCPPGRICTVTVEIDTTGLWPGERHLAAVTLAPAGGELEVVPVQVGLTAAGQGAVPATGEPAVIRVRPGRIDFGRVAHTSISTPRKRIRVVNAGKVPARCRILDAPSWLLLKPQAFSLAPGASQSVELVGRIAKVRDRRAKAVLTIAPERGRSAQVEVMLRIKGGGFFG